MLAAGNHGVAFDYIVSVGMHYGTILVYFCCSFAYMIVYDGPHSDRTNARDFYVYAFPLPLQSIFRVSIPQQCRGNVRACVRACVRTYVHACVRACVCVCRCRFRRVHLLRAC